MHDDLIKFHCQVVMIGRQAADDDAVGAGFTRSRGMHGNATVAARRDRDGGQRDEFGCLGIEASILAHSTRQSSVLIQIVSS
jgi:hypothetical protein